MEAGRKISPGVLVALVLLIAVVVIFAISFVVASQPTEPAPLTVETDDIETRVSGLLANASAERGADLVVSHQCVNCHVYAAGLAAPGWNNLADRAENRDPELSAAAYLYESITEPTVFLVEGFAPSMPQNFSEVLTDEETGDIIAYLLTLRTAT